MRRRHLRHNIQKYKMWQKCKFLNWASVKLYCQYCMQGDLVPRVRSQAKFRLRYTYLPSPLYLDRKSKRLPFSQNSVTSQSWVTTPSSLLSEAMNPRIFSCLKNILICQRSFDTIYKLLHKMVLIVFLKHWVFLCIFIIIA